MQEKLEKSISVLSPEQNYLFIFAIRYPVLSYYTAVIAIKKLDGFQLEFLSISRVINHMLCYNFDSLIGRKFIKKKNPLQNLLSSMNTVISTNESTRTGHVI